MRLPKRLNLRAKLYMTVSAFLVPLVIVVVLLVQVSAANIAFNTQEVRGARLLKPLFEFLTHLPDAGPSSGRAAAWDVLGRAWDGVEALAGTLPRVDVVPVREAWKSLKDESDEATFQTKMIDLKAKVAGLIVAISDASNLTLDPDLDSYYLMNLTVFQLVPAWQRLDSLETGLLNHAINEEYQRDLIPLIDQVDRPGIAASVGTIVREDPNFMGPLPGLAEALPPLASAVDSTLASTVTSLSSGTAEERHSSALKARMALQELWVQSNLYLDAMCQKRVDRYTGDLFWSLFWSGLAVLAGLAMMAAVLWSLIRQIRGLNRSVAALSEGDFTVEAPVLSGDELGQVARNLGVVTQGLRERFRTMEQILLQLQSSAESAQSHSAQLDHGIAVQTDAYRGITAEVSRLAESAIVLGRTSADQTREAEQNTKVLAGLLEQSRALGQETLQAQTVARDRASAAQGEVANLDRGLDRYTQLATLLSSLDSGMQAVQGESNRMDEVLTGLNDIASRTGLLAMNASIQAAHAGVAGRGFAVIADAVRKLAEQANQSVATSSQLLGSVRQKIAEGAGLSQVAAQEASQLADLSRSVRDQLHHLSVGLESSATLMAQVSRQLDAQAPLLADLETRGRTQQALSAEAGATTSKQTEGTLQIQSSLGNLSEISTETSETAAELKSLAAELREDSRTLDGLIRSLRY